MRRRSKRAVEDYETGDGSWSSGGSGSLVLQVTKMEDRAESHKRRSSESEEEQFYSPEPISVWPPRPTRTKKN